MDGLVTMTPTSIDHVGTSASINANGGVDFEGVTSLSLNGVFTGGDDGFDNYRVVINFIKDAGISADMQMALRASGADATSNFTSQRLRARDVNVDGIRTNDSRFGDLGATSLYSGLEAHFYGPGLGQPTAIRTFSSAGRDNASLYDYAQTHSLDTSYDGFTIYSSNAESFTGNLIVMGYAE
jgi:hypothetical protein